MRARRLPAVLVATVAVLTALAGCSDGGDGGGSGAGSEPAGTATDVAVRTTASPQAVASLTGLVPGRTIQDSQGLRITVTPVTLRREGKLALLEIAARNEEAEQRANLANSIRGSGLAFDEVTLVDPANGKRYLVARDSQDKCLCTSFFGGMSLEPGTTGIVSAYFAAPPENVTALDVVVPTAGTFTGVPLS